MSNWANAAAVLANKSHLEANSTSTAPSSAPEPKTPPSMSSASARAALLAHKAAIAHQADHKLSESAAQESMKDARDRALLAATKSFSQKPASPKKLTSPAKDRRDAELASKRIAARQQESQSRQDIIHIRKEMLTEHPPIRMEVEEKQHQEALRASAISLARTVYNKKVEPQDTNTPAKEQAKQYVSLQDAAQKLAAERLAKINESANSPLARAKSTRSTGIFNKLRRNHRRTNSDGADDATTEKVRRKMASLRSQIAAVDIARENKENTERDRIMAAAERKVHAQMQTLDATVFADTGKMSPAMMSDWDAQARARRAQVNHVINMKETQTDSAVDVGAGKIVDRAEVERLAEQRVGPTIKGIEEAVEKRKKEEQEKKERAEEERRMAREEREKRREERAEKRRLEEEERQERRARERQLQTAAILGEIIQPSSIRAREQEEVVQRREARLQTSSALQEIVDAENDRERKIREERAKTALALEGVIQAEHDREEKAKQEKAETAKVLEEIVSGEASSSPSIKKREERSEKDKLKTSEALQTIIDAEIKRELKVKEQKQETAKTLDEIARGDALFASIKKEEKVKKRNSFSILRRKSSRNSQVNPADKRHSVALPIPEERQVDNLSQEESSLLDGVPVEPKSTPAAAENTPQRVQSTSKQNLWSRLRSRHTQSADYTAEGAVIASELKQQEKEARQKEKQEKQEREKLEKEKAREEKAEKARLALEEKEKVNREKIEKARLAHEERERINQEKIEKARLESEEKEKQRQEKIAKARIEDEKKEKLHREKLEKEKLELEESARLHREKLEKEKLELEEKARLHREKLEKERLEMEEKAKLHQEQLGQSRSEHDEQEREKRANLELLWVEKEKAHQEALEKARLEKKGVLEEDAIKKLTMTKPVEEEAHKEQPKPREYKPSKLKAAFDRLKRRTPGGASALGLGAGAATGTVLTKKKWEEKKEEKKEEEETKKAEQVQQTRQDGDSTELEDSSDEGSFHSTRLTGDDEDETESAVLSPEEASFALATQEYAVGPIPPPPELHTLPTELHTLPTVPETEVITQQYATKAVGPEAHEQVPVSRPVTVPGADNYELGDEHSETVDKLRGAHLETRFHEEL